jgi:hypothetical protein
MEGFKSKARACRWEVSCRRHVWPPVESNDRDGDALTSIVSHHKRYRISSEFCHNNINQRIMPLLLVVPYHAEAVIVPRWTSYSREVQTHTRRRRQKRKRFRSVLESIGEFFPDESCRPDQVSGRRHSARQ